jgi:hypothetical protein
MGIKNINKKGMNEVGVGIIIMALLLFMGGIFVDTSSNNSKNSVSDYEGDGEDILWKIEDSHLGSQVKETESFPNIELGSKEKVDIVYIGNSFRLNSNMFAKNIYEFDLSFKDPEDVSSVLIYFNIDRVRGENPIIIKYNGNEVLRTLAKSSDLPLSIPVKISNPENFSSMRVSFEIEKPAFYNLFNWNKIDFSGFKIAQVSEDTSNRNREFNFQIENDEFLENVYVDLLIDCDEVLEVSEAVKVTVNGYIILNNNPNCQSSNAKITGNIPLNILNSDVEKNTILFETEGYYKVGYGINKVYFNDKKNYKFSLHNFNGVGDIIMYGDFDKSVIDIKINNHQITLVRDEITSILDYLRLGTNEIKILTDKVEIEELVIENDRWNYYENNN